MNKVNFQHRYAFVKYDYEDDADKAKNEASNKENGTIYNGG